MARKSIKILNGRANALPPTEKFPRWRVIWTDPVTGKRRQTSGGDSLDSAKAKAAEILGDYVPDSESGVRPPTFDECFHSWMDAVSLLMTSRLRMTRSPSPRTTSSPICPRPARP